MSFFAHQAAAERYALARPYFHPQVVSMTKDRIGIERPLPTALDVGCGTGQSTEALAAIATRITGTDISWEMLARAKPNPQIAYVQARAEQLPFEGTEFDLVTAGLAFHWFERERFLSEASWVLKPGGWLVVYNNAFTGQMEENPEYAKWAGEVYLKRYPTPPRNNKPVTDADAEAFGLMFVARETYSNAVRSSVEEHAAYLMTQTNVIAAVEQGSESSRDAYEWLVDSLRPLFLAPVCTFQFGGWILYLQKQATPGAGTSPGSGGFAT